MALRTQSVIPVVLLKCQHLVRGLSTQDSKQDRQKEQQQPPITGEANAYEVLGLHQSCSEVTIRAAFRKLAKATHPDLQTDTSTAHFIRILAAYEILSDPAKRAEYDKHLSLKRAVGKTQNNASRTRGRSSGYNESGGDVHSSMFYEEQDSAASSTEVVSWLKGYRAMVRAALHRQEIGKGTGGWEDELRGEVQSALRRAYYGPPVSEQEGLPECFEAEERAQPDVQDVLHLVSGRHLFGFVRQVQNPALDGQHQPTGLLQASALEHGSDDSTPNLSNSGMSSSLDEASDLARRYYSSSGDNEARVAVHKVGEGTPFVDLELELFGNIVARSIRVPYRNGCTSDTNNTDEQDCIYVYLSSEQVEDASEFVDGTIADDSKFSRTLLGTIRGLRSKCDRNICFVHAPDGKRTHLIMQHTTPLVKNMQWFRVGEGEGEGSAPCECRCRRATILPSRYWIFEPRTDTHNVGGWYIETFDQSRRSSKRNSRRYLKQYGSSIGTDEERKDKMLHPAMYIMAAAYKTLDEEDKAVQKKEASIWNRINKLVDLPGVTSGFVHWWKRKWTP
ncbi:unnamed protein product [Calypogeia fissa]